MKYDEPACDLKLNNINVTIIYHITKLFIIAQLIHTYRTYWCITTIKVECLFYRIFCDYHKNILKILLIIKMNGRNDFGKWN